MAEPEASTLAPGTRVGGRFVLERLLRRAVVTEVYLARSEGGGTARFEARRDLSAAPSARAEGAVRRELDRVASAGSRAIPTVAAVVSDPAGLIVVTEAPEALAPRDTIRDLLARGERLAPRDAVRILREVARALDAVHTLVPQVVHRALCPENVLLMERRQKVWLTECGLGHALAAAGAVAPRTHLVEAAYCSPDELLHRPTIRGDVFSLASLAFESLCGRAAFRGATEAATESAMLRGPRPSLGDGFDEAGPRLDAVLQRAWTSDADGGFARASELVSALERAVDPSGQSTGPVSSRTIIGLGGPAQRTGAVIARPAPRAPFPTEPTGEASRSAPRVLPPTQKVLVPRIHPPGTEPVQVEPPRDERETPVAPAPRAPLAAAEPRRTSIAPSDIPPDQFEITKPVRIDPPPEAKGDIVAEIIKSSSERPQRDSWEAILRDKLPESDETTAVRRPEVQVAEALTERPPANDPVVTVPSSTEIPPPAGERDEDVEIESVEAVEAVEASAPPPALSRPPPPPPRTSAPSAPSLTPSPSDGPSARPEASSPETLDQDAIDALGPDTAAPSATLADALPSIFDTPIPAPLEARPLSDLPPPSAVATAPEAPAAPTAASGRVVYPALTEAPPAPPRPLRAGGSRGWVVGVAVAALLLGGLGAAAWRKLRAERDDVARARVTGPTFGTRDAGAVASPAVDSGALASADVASDLSRDAFGTREDIAARAEDSAVDAGGDVAAAQPADAGAQTVDAAEAPRDVLAAPSATDASTASGAGLVAPVMSGATPRSHPRGRETIALEEALYDEVIACVRGRHRRRVRVVATYLGATGLADEIHVSSPYNEPETRPCIEAAVRRHPVGRFTDESWETGLVFDPDEE